MHPVTVFIERFRAAVSVLIGPCCHLKTWVGPMLIRIQLLKSGWVRTQKNT